MAEFKERKICTFEEAWKASGGDKQIEGKIEPEAIDAYIEAMRDFYATILKLCGYKETER